MLQGLGFKTDDFERPTETFSGGWQMRIALAKLLLGQPNLLLLDEPTNHLDLEARNWLEEYLNAYPHAVILVSHDRFFLDAVVTRIADLTLRTLTDYIGNYSDYLVEHHERIEALRKAKREQDEEVARVKMFIDRFRYQATKASQVQSRIKMLEKVVPIEVPPERKKIHFDFPACAKSGRTVLELKHARKAYGDRRRLQRPEPAHRARRPHRAGRPERRRQVDADADAVGRGSARRRRARRRPQRRHAVFRAGRSDAHRSGADGLRNARVGIAAADGARRSATSSAASCSRATTSTSTCGVLSGGERTRLAVARMLLRPSNTLLLDEPTNHLDLDSKEVLLDALVDYGGTLIFVSHDRYFVERLATKIIEIGSGTAVVYPGHLQGVPVAQGARQDGAQGRTAGRQTAQRQAEAAKAGRQDDAKPQAHRRSRKADTAAQPARRTQRRVRPNSRTKKRSARTPRRARSRARLQARQQRSTRSSRGSPRPRPPSSEIEQRCPRPASTTIAPPRSRSSTGTRR